MKLTSIKYKLSKSISDSIIYECIGKTLNSASSDIRIKIHNEIWTPNVELIEKLQMRTLDNLQNEIN